MYKFEPIDHSKAGIQQCADLLHLVFQEHEPDKFSYDYVNWLYTQSPRGKVFGFNAFAGELMVSHFMAQPIRVVMDGKEIKGVWGYNGVTHPDHWGKKLFFRLAEMTLDYGRENGFEFYIGVTNAVSTPGYLKYLDFQLVKRLDVKIGVGLYKDHDEGKSNYEYCRQWSREELEWRLSNPRVRYGVIRDGDYAFVIAPTKKYGIHAIIAKLPFSDVPAGISKMRASLNPLRIWMGVDENINWKSSKFFNFPERLKPSPLCLIYKDITGGNRQLHPELIKYHTIDFDAF